MKVINMATNEPKLLIVVSGGVIQSIYFTDDKPQIEILDFDNEELKSSEEEEELLKIKSEGLKAIY